MPRHRPTEVLRTNLVEHSAVRAWSELSPRQLDPKEIVILREKKNSAAYRIVGVRPGGCDVIAKRCPKAKALIERTFYEEILPHIPIYSLRYYGYVGEEEDQFCWLFLEDAGKDKYLPFVSEHRTLAARWLAVTHTAAACLGRKACFIDRGAKFWLKDLNLAKLAVIRGLANRALSDDGIAVLRTMVSQCELIESHWNWVEELSDSAPQTLVHCDLNSQNMRVRQIGPGLSFLPFDWGRAGWGPPALDLAQSMTKHSEGYSANPDLICYWQVVREHWPGLNFQRLQQLAVLGSIFCYVGFIRAEARSLATDWVEKPVREMKMFQREIDSAIDAIGWRR